MNNKYSTAEMLKSKEQKRIMKMIDRLNKDCEESFKDHCDHNTYLHFIQEGL